MFMSLRHVFCIGLVLLSATAFAEVKTIIVDGRESLVYDTETGNYTATLLYVDDDTKKEETHTFVIVPNHTNPSLRSSFRIDASGDMIYQYEFRNNAKFKQDIISFGLPYLVGLLGAPQLDGAGQIKTIWENKAGLPVEEVVRQTVVVSGNDIEKLHQTKFDIGTPPNWKTSVSMAALNETALSVNWSTQRFTKDTTQGVKPGQRLGGFRIVSSALPGIHAARFSSTAPHANWGPASLTVLPPSSSMAVLKVVGNVQGTLNYLYRTVAVPLIEIPEPFDAAVLLERIQKHVKTNITSIPSKDRSYVPPRLIDPAFTAILDAQFAVAINAARFGNIESTRYQVRELRRLIKQERTDMNPEEDDEKFDDDRPPRTIAARIDRLSARVLDFNLKYIDKRLNPGSHR